MSRVRSVFTTILPAMLAGGLIFHSAFGNAAAGGEDPSDPWASSGTAPGSDDDAPVRRAPAPRTAQGPRTPPVPPVPPAPPTPPVPPHGRHGGISVNIDGHKLDLHGIDGMVRGQLDAARAMIRNNPSIPPQVRDKVLKRLDKARAIVDKRLKNLRGKDVSQIGPEMEAMGEELEQAMEGLEEEMEALSDTLGKDFAKNLPRHLGPGSKFNFKLDIDSDDDDDDDLGGVSVDVDDPDDMADALDDLRGMALKPAQKDQLAKLRAESDRNVAAAKRQLDDVSTRLETALADPRTTDAVIARYVDEISAHEAAIRKARILAWVNARRVLDDAQRKQIEAAARKKSR